MSINTFFLWQRNSAAVHLKNHVCQVAASGVGETRTRDLLPRDMSIPPLGHPNKTQISIITSRIGLLRSTTELDIPST